MNYEITIRCIKLGLEQSFLRSISMLDSIHNAFVSQGWNQVVTGNRTRFKVVGLGRTPDIPSEVERSTDYLLANVPCLDMSGTPMVQAETQEISSLNYIEAFAAMLPNLEELDLCY